MSQAPRNEDPLQALKDVVGESTLFIALFGAGVSTALSWIPFSPLLGGLLAGWLVRDDRSRGAMVGGISGAILMLPFAFVGLFVFGFAALDSVASGVFILIVLVVIGIITLLYTAGISALGGYIGVKLYQDRAGSNTHTHDTHTTHDHHDDDGWGEDEDDDGWGDDASADSDGGFGGGGDGGGE